MEAQEGGQEGSLRAPSTSPGFLLAYLQQLVQEVHLVLVPGLRLVPHKLHQSPEAFHSLPVHVLIAEADERFLDGSL